jgi:hypothetical protein
VLLVAGMLLTGVAFAHWSESLLLTGSVATGELDWRFTDVGHLDPGPTDSVRDYHCRDNFEGPEPYYWQGDKDVGYTTAVITADPHVIEVTLNNVYPSYFNSISVYFKNTGTVPLIIEEALIDGHVVMSWDEKVRLDLNDDGENDLEIWWGANIFGIQLEPGKKGPETSFWVHVLQGAPRDKSLKFTIQLIAVQYNFSEHPKPTIGLNPTSLTFSAVLGGSNPSPQSVTVSNTEPAGSVLSWTATDDADWLSESPTSGILGAGASKPMTVSVDISGLSAGTYTATITVSDPNATNSPQTVSVTLNLQPATYSANLHPNEGVDRWGSHPGDCRILTPGDLNLLEASDDNRYRNNKEWHEKYEENRYIEFGFENIPAEATVLSAVLKFEWQRTSDVDNARLRIWNGSSWSSDYYYLFPLPPENTDTIVTLDLKTDYGIDTAAKVNNLRVRFQATDPGGDGPPEKAFTWHDWVEVQVTYTL